MRSIHPYSTAALTPTPPRQEGEVCVRYCSACAPCPIQAQTCPCPCSTPSTCRVAPVWT